MKPRPPVSAEHGRLIFRAFFHVPLLKRSTAHPSLGLVSAGLFMMLCLAGCGFFGRSNTLEDLPSLITTDTPVEYVTEIIVDNILPHSGSYDTPGTLLTRQNHPDRDLAPPLIPALAAQTLQIRMEDNSQLIELVEQPPDSLLGLERRAAMDQETAIKLMHSLGYYDGEAWAEIDARLTPMEVRLYLEPGRQYVMGNITIAYEPQPAVPPSFIGRTRVTGYLFKHLEELPGPEFPILLPAIEAGEPALADTLLDAVTDLPLIYQRRGYPTAKVSSTVYSINKELRTLDARIVVDAGFPATMGEVRIEGVQNVNPIFLQRLVPWEENTPWDVELFNEYRHTLQQLGLFSVVNLNPLLTEARRPGQQPRQRRTRQPEPAIQTEAPAAGEEGSVTSSRDSVRREDVLSSPAEAVEPSSSIPPVPPSPPARESVAFLPPILPVSAQLNESAPRTVGAEINYSNDWGVGVQGTWEHRNLWGYGERLWLEAPIAEKRQGFQASFSKPAFYHRDQSLLAGASALREKTDSYTNRSAATYVGLERVLTPRWTVDGRVGLESGKLEERHDTNDYRFVSVRLGVRRDTRDNRFDPKRGSLITISATPYYGNYIDNFQNVALEADVAFYFSPAERLTLGARAAIGSMSGQDSFALPPPIRYYVGGGGSVRGYAYQAIGPRDAWNDPIGGRSYNLFNLEARIGINENLSVVPFLDGGMVYDTRFPNMGQDLYWGAGLGVRYHTPVGPLRLDVAFPLRNIKGEDPFQLYISIGQAF